MKQRAAAKDVEVCGVGMPGIGEAVAWFAEALPSVFETGEATLMEMNGAPHADGCPIRLCVTKDEKNEEQDGKDHEPERHPQLDGEPDPQEDNCRCGQARPAQKSSPPLQRGEGGRAV